MKVVQSSDNRRLYLGHIPIYVTAYELLEKLKNVVSGIVAVILPPCDYDPSYNRGYAFLDFESHRAAAMARRHMLPGGIRYVI